MRTQDEKQLETIYEGLGNYPAGMSQGDSNPSSPYYQGRDDGDVIDQYWDEITAFLSNDWGPVNILDIEIEDSNFLVKFQYQDEIDGTIEDTVERVKDSDVGADLDPDPDF
jgi:hypothetical protein